MLLLLPLHGRYRKGGVAEEEGVDFPWKLLLQMQEREGNASVAAIFIPFPFSLEAMRLCFGEFFGFLFVPPYLSTATYCVNSFA